MLIIGWFITQNAVAASDEKYFKVAALPGDGSISMLRRYQLDKNSCNFAQFYKLNKITKKTTLVIGREYSLPILIYPFNGKNIRSSVGINDFDIATRIQKYNETMLAAQLRDQSYKQDKILWVPYHELHCAKADVAIPSPTTPEPELVKTGKRVFPIFGKYAYTPLRSNNLKGKVFLFPADTAVLTRAHLANAVAKPFVKMNTRMMCRCVCVGCWLQMVRRRTWSYAMRTTVFETVNC